MAAHQADNTLAGTLTVPDQVMQLLQVSGPEQNQTAGGPGSAELLNHKLTKP